MDNITSSHYQYLLPSTVKAQQKTNNLTLFATKLQALVKKFSSYFSTTFTQSHNYQSQTVDSSGGSFNKRNIKRFFKRSMYLPFVIVFVLLSFFIFIALRNVSNGTPAVASLTGDERVDVKKPVATQTINKTYLFPITDDKGKEVSRIKYHIESAEIRNEIIWNGKRGTSVKGRTFLIMNLRVTNDYNLPIELNTKDYMRLTVNNSTEKLAPDLHNDPIEIQAISTKPTRLGFPINDDFKTLDLQIGEITGPKQTLKLDLQ